MPTSLCLHVLMACAVLMGYVLQAQAARQPELDLMSDVYTAKPHPEKVILPSSDHN